MSIILHIETATKSCSVAISKKGVLLGHKEEHPESFVHSEKLTKYINDLLQGLGIGFSQIDAISVSSGPGSYTGLRIGSSTAKGLCFALQIPLISVPTLKSFDSCARKKGLIGNICVMIDARRMEVYSRISSSEKKVLKKTSPDILDEDTYKEFEPFIAVGDGAFKTKEFWSNRDVKYDFSIKLSAIGQVSIAYEMLKKKQVQKLENFEPNYFKDFIATFPKKGIQRLS
ncbi:MAG: tRNA (adenosine(37)-N6)-threonylcarbamoyltransferase complex dimerization subunit type 1 TsaB [Crocinitomicaceae bacterium]|nr:tRNA (adenosine(37)-N6)-threonylcarbamoyltransferase complex dimerization subunit type 1 TsaB [Crocinitomicaceae bacterium]